MNAKPPTNSGDLVAKYEGYSHEDLYNWVKSGNPGQLDGLASEWKKIVTGCHDLSVNLNTELGNVDKQWTSASGDEFQRRMKLVSTFAGDLASDIGNFHTTLTGMSGALRDAQKHNEDPDKTDDSDSTIGGAAVGTVLGGPVGGVIGGAMGHDRDEKQRKAAKNRMVHVVATLAGEYQNGSHSWNWTDASPDMPGDDTHDSPVTTVLSLSGPGTSSAPGSNPSATHDTERGRFDGHTSPPPGHGSDDGGNRSGDGGSVGGAGAGHMDGSGLAGAGGGPTGVGVGGGLSGAGLGGASGTGLASSPGGFGGGLAGGGAQGAGGRPAARRGIGATGRRGEGEDGSEEYTTWLTEDDMVWGADADASSGVIGGRPREEAGS